MKQALSISDNTNWVCDDVLLNFSVDIYHHFTIKDGKKYMVTTDAATKTILLRSVEIKPVLQEEKKDNSLVPRPFAFYFYKPER
jgi:hypothetical protein